MSQPMIKVGKYTGAGAAISQGIGFIPDTLIIQNITDQNAIYICNPNLTNFSNGTTTVIYPASTVSQLGATGKSYVTVMGPINTGSVKKHGFVVGNKLALTGKVYVYTALRSDTGSDPNL